MPGLRVTRVPSFGRIAAGLLLAGFMQPSDHALAQTAEEQIQATLRRVEAGYAAGDAEGLIAAMTEDVILLPPGADPIRGRAAVLARYERFFSRGRMELTMETQEVRIADGWAALRGTMRGQRLADGEEASEGLAGKFMMVFDRQSDGSWKVARLIWNDDAETD